MGKVGKEAQFVNGLRVTDEETMEIAEMVLGRINKQLVTMVQELGVKAVASAARTGGCFGWIGNMRTARISALWGISAEWIPRSSTIFLEKDFLPIVAPIGLDEDFVTYNINADDAACAIARAVGRTSWCSLRISRGCTGISTTKPPLFPGLRFSDADALISDGFIEAVCFPSWKTALGSEKRREQSPHSGRRILHCLLLEIFTNEGVEP